MSTQQFMFSLDQYLHHQSQLEPSTSAFDSSQFLAAPDLSPPSPNPAFTYGNASSEIKSSRHGSIQSVDENYNNFIDFNDNSSLHSHTSSSPELNASATESMSNLQFFDPTYMGFVPTPAFDNHASYFDEKGFHPPQLINPSLHHFTNNHFQQQRNLNEFISPQDTNTSKPKKKRKQRTSFKSSSAVDPDNSELEEEGEGTLDCPECPKKFNRLFNLKSHMKSHASERNYQCELCPTSFRRSHDLKRHHRSLHSTEKNFACQFCSKKFSRMDALKRHGSRVYSPCFKEY